MADDHIRVVTIQYDNDQEYTWNGEQIVNESKDALELTRINENGTVDEMIKTINANFENIAKHGGGPGGLNGKNGTNGANGVNAEYIYARADVMIRNQHYPEVDTLKESLFDAVNASESGHAPYNSTIEWYSHPQGVDSTHKNEYVLTRYKRGTDGSDWYYASEPVLWAHWGEMGLDGDGVEYIFYRSKGELTSSEIDNLYNNISLDKLSGNQKVIYNIDGFYPGADWFNNKNRNEAFELYTNSGLSENFTTLWNNKFNFQLGWTDEPLGTTPEYKYEYVSTRKSTTEDGKKSWGTFSRPSLWSSYGYATRTFIVYYNGGETSPGKPSGGWWDVNEDKLITNKQGYKLTEGWSDTHTETIGKITWMSSGMFGHDGKNISWSDPVRITGENGKNGEDGTKMQFIYALTSNPKYPNTVPAINDLFDIVEGKTPGRSHDDNGYFYTYEGTKWYDNALSISERDKEEYFASRTRTGVEGGSENWTPMMAPVLWARWGEDGTDGDGVEYIFHTSTSKDKNTAFTEDGKSLLPVKLENMSSALSKYQKIIHNIDDFYPGEEWFNKEGQRNTVKQLLQTKLGESFNESVFNTQWDGTNKFGFNLGWTDNPQGTKASAPFEWVSIRKSTTPEGTKERVWGDFSEPKLWASYNVTAITFTVYCNVPEGVTVTKIDDGEGKWKISNNSLVNTDNSTPFRYKAVSETLNNYFNLNKHIGVWEDGNYDVSPNDYPDGVSVMIKWAATGRFKEDGDVYGSNIAWSKPMRITGDKGEPGADGDNTQYIYARIDKFVLDGDDAPIGDSESDKTNRDTLFDNVENSTNDPKCYKLDDYAVTWYDNPQGIDEEHRIEWIWSRQRKSGEDEWIYGEPVIWSRWGEDGTDGDGIEYIFFKTNQNPLTTSKLPNIEFDKENGTLTKLGKCQEVVYQFDDFYPDDAWFKDSRREEIFEAIEAAGITITDANEENDIWSGLKNSFNIGWTDNPSGVDVYYPFEWVSMRKGKPDKDGKRVWGAFSEPKLWAKFNIRTRDFIVYCNMESESAVPVKPQDDGTHCRYIGYWEDGTSPEFRISESSDSKFKSNALPDGQYPKEGNTEESINDPSKWTNSIGYWEDTNKDVPNTIAWMCTGTFSEKGNNISWSEPFRITGYKGQPGADGSNIEFIYTLCDDEPKYPKYNIPTDYDTVNSFFNSVESAGINGYPYKSDPDNVEETPTIWYDNAQAIADEDGKRKEWVWSRSKAAGASTTNWTFAPKPVIWAHWGEDGTDGDGVEYIFSVSQTPWDISESDWNNFINNMPTTDTAKAIYSMDDFIPNSRWFTDNNNNKTKVQTKMTEKGKTFDESAWTSTETYYSLNEYAPNDPLCSTWTDNPNSLGPVWRYQYVSIRKMSNGVWGPFSYPALWSKYSLSKFTSFAFIKLYADEDISDVTPSGGTYLNPIPNSLELTRNNNPVSIRWTDTPQVPDETEVVWMSSAEFDEGVNGPSKSWSKPQRMVDTATFNVEWSSNDLTLSEIEQINEVLSGEISSVVIDDTQQESSYFNFGTVLKNLSYQVDEAEREWRDRIDKLSSVLIGKNLNFGDDTGNAVLMATCQLKNGEWSNWVIKRIKGEQGIKGDPGTSINVKGKIIYEVYFDSDDKVYNYTNAQHEMQAYTSELSPTENGLLIVYPKSFRPEYNDYWGESQDGALYMWKYENGAWHDFNNTDKTTYDNRQEEGDCYTSLNKHLILWDGDSWQDVGELQGPEGKRWILVIKYANGTPGDREFVTNDSDIPSAEWIGTFMYLDDGTDHSTHLNDENYTANVDSTTERGWIWSLFKGQDGHGLEYIFKATSDDNQPPYVPNTSTAEDEDDDFVPTSEDVNNVRYGWSDEPIEPTPEKKYVWMCWRKFNTSTQSWTKFMGVDKKTYNADPNKCGVARLWQVYARSIAGIDEYFYAANQISPNWQDLGDQSTSTSIDTNFWLNKSTATDSDHWNSTNRYLFNREVVRYTYSSDVPEVLEPHFIAVYADGVKDIIDYYCLDTDGESAPNINESTPYNPITTGGDEKIEGIDYWTTDVKKTKISSEHKYLWNVSQKIYEDEHTSWTTPYVVAIFDRGDNGDDAVYVDLDNEMDTVQIEKSGKVINGSTYETILHMYKGSDLLKIKKCEIAGEYNSYCSFEYLIGANWSNYTGGNSITGGFDALKMSINLSGDNKTIDEYRKIQFTATSINNDVRTVTYTLVGSTNPAKFSIIPYENTLILTKRNVIEPSRLTISVFQSIGDKTYEHGEDVSGEGGFELKVYKNNTDITNQFTAPDTKYDFNTNDLNLSSGDKLTFKVYADSEDNDTNPDIVMDVETIYVLKEVEDGLAGKGYDYRYIRKEGATSCSIDSSYLTSNDPYFNVTVNGSPLSMKGTTYAQGVNSSFMYEWRSERTTKLDGTWDNWSSPITIARYYDINDPDFDSILDRAIEGKKDDIAGKVEEDLSGDLQRLNILSEYFDEDGNLISGIDDSLLSGYAKDGEIHLGGIIVGDGSDVTTFSNWLNNNEFTSVKDWLDAVEGVRTTAVTSTDLEGSISTAMDTFRADVTDHFATMDRIVANVSYLKDEDGCLLEDKLVPVYGTITVSTSDSAGVYIIPENSVTVEKLLNYLQTGEGLTNLSNTAGIYYKNATYYVLSHFDTNKSSFTYNISCTPDTSSASTISLIPSSSTDGNYNNYAYIPVFENKYERLVDTEHCKFIKNNSVNTNGVWNFHVTNASETEFETDGGNSIIYDSEYRLYVNAPNKDKIILQYNIDTRTNYNVSHNIRVYIQYKTSENGTWVAQGPSASNIGLNYDTNGYKTGTYKTFEYTIPSTVSTGNIWFRFYATFNKAVIQGFTIDYFFKTQNQLITTSTSNPYATNFTIAYSNNGSTRTFSNTPNYILQKIRVCNINDGGYSNPTKKYIRGRVNTLTRNVVEDVFLNPHGYLIKDYTAVYAEDEPYLIPITTEMASISQSVSNGIACTSIITNVDDKKAVFVQEVTPTGSSIYMNANEIGIRSDYFNLNNDGLRMSGDIIANTFKTVNEKTSIGTDGVLHASGAVIDGDITVNELNTQKYFEHNGALENVGSVDYELTKRTIINTNEFKISVQGNMDADVNSGDDYYAGTIDNYLSIQIMDVLKNPNTSGAIDDKYLYGVPVLCFYYKGTKYVLSPGSWINPGDTTSSNMYWVTKFDVYNYTFGTNYNYPKYYNSDDKYYICNDNYSSNLITNTSETKLCRFFVQNLGKDKVTNISSITSWYLTSYNNPSDAADINSGGAYALKSNITANDVVDLEDSAHAISSRACEIFYGYLRNEIICNLKYNFTETLTNINTGDFYANGIYNNFIKGIVNAGEPWIYNNGIQEYNINFEGDGLKYLASLSYTSNYTVKVDIDAYPQVNINNYGKAPATSIKIMLIKCTYTFTLYYPNTRTISYTQSKSSGSDSSEYTQNLIGAKYILTFYIYINSTTDIIPSYDITNGNNAIKSAVQSYLSKIINNSSNICRPNIISFAGEVYTKDDFESNNTKTITKNSFNEEELDFDV